VGWKSSETGIIPKRNNSCQEPRITFFAEVYTQSTQVLTDTRSENAHVRPWHADAHLASGLDSAQTGSLGDGILNGVFYPYYIID
jgi:hypothetical protein